MNHNADLHLECVLFSADQRNPNDETWCGFWIGSARIWSCCWNVWFQYVNTVYMHCSDTNQYNNHNYRCDICWEKAIRTKQSLLYIRAEKTAKYHNSYDFQSVFFLHLCWVVSLNSGKTHWICLRFVKVNLFLCDNLCINFFYREI